MLDFGKPTTSGSKDWPKYLYIKWETNLFFQSVISPKISKRVPA